MDRNIRDLARHTYNPPPEPPRDEIWARIQAAREAMAAPEDSAPAPAPVVIDFASRAARIRRWSLRVLPIAALLLVAFGLGRLSLLYERSRQVVAGESTTSPATAAQRSVSAPVGDQPQLARAEPAATEPMHVAERSPLAAAPAAPGTARRARDDEAARSTSRSLYRFAAAQTLGQAEMLLTSFRADAKSGGTVDPQVTSWAGDVLSNTRLLLDSPAGRDPRLRPLLEDLELVLAQIVQLRAAPAGTAGADADLIDHALQQRDIMPRLRTAVPAGVGI